MTFRPIADQFKLGTRVVLAVALLSATASAQHYTQKNLFSNTGTGGSMTDPNLVNGWGISRGSATPWWVSDNGTGKATLYMGDGTKAPLVVTVPGAPTGTVFNGTSDFEIMGSPALFLFASEDGTISAWNRAAGTQAMTVITTPGAIYKGLAIADIRGVNYLYAADFHHGRIDVFDSSFHPVKRGFNGDGDFDWDDFPRIDHELRGFAPFNIENIGGTLFVAFAKQDSQKHDDVPGLGNGFLAAFTARGKLVKIYQHGPWLNAPWGMTLAPDDFGIFSHHLLVGQFGSGQIAAYNISSGRFTALMLDPSGKALAIDGLWGLGFGNGGKAGPYNSLFFAAGPNEESNGLFGVLTVAPGDPTQGNSN
jgi:uncharacterized protein (TIGR03118 family)